jgi:hypothetical protein
MNGREGSITTWSRAGTPSGNRAVPTCCRINNGTYKELRAFVPVFVFGGLLRDPVQQLTTNDRNRGSGIGDREEAPMNYTTPAVTKITLAGALGEKCDYDGSIMYCDW